MTNDDTAPLIGLLKSERIQEEIAALPDWIVDEQGRLAARYLFIDPQASLRFVIAVADEAGPEGWSPQLHHQSDAQVTIRLSIDPDEGITEEDLARARRIAALPKPGRTGVVRKER